MPGNLTRLHRYQRLVSRTALNAPCLDSPGRLSGVSCIDVGNVVQEKFVPPNVLDSQEQVTVAPVIPRPAFPDIRSKKTVVFFASVSFFSCLRAVRTYRTRSWKRIARSGEGSRGEGAKRVQKSAGRLSCGVCHGFASDDVDAVRNGFCDGRSRSPSKSWMAASDHSMRGSSITMSQDDLKQRQHRPRHDQSDVATTKLVRPSTARIVTPFHGWGARHCGKCHTFLAWFLPWP
jgi:hypothetical protein